MVVLSAALLSRGKTLLARQFIEISRLRIEGLLSAFLKLIESSDKKDHTYIESDSVRYVYLPMEQLYLVLVTNKQSNILEDLETLKLMQKTVQDCCDASVSEAMVLTKAFEIVFAFDEIITFGYRECVTVAQVKAFMEMESNEEKLSLMLLQEKMREERKRSQMIASRLDKERSELLKQEAQMKQQQQQLTASQLSVVVDGTLGSIHEPTIIIDASSATIDDTSSRAEALSPSTTPQPSTASSLLPKGMQLGKNRKPSSSLAFLETQSTTTDTKTNWLIVPNANS